MKYIHDQIKLQQMFATFDLSDISHHLVMTGTYSAPLGLIKLSLNSSYEDITPILSLAEIFTITLLTFHRECDLDLVLTVKCGSKRFPSVQNRSHFMHNYSPHPPQLQILIHVAWNSDCCLEDI